MNAAKVSSLILSLVMVGASSAHGVQLHNNRKARAALTVAFVKTIHWTEGTAHMENPYRTRFTHEQVPANIPLDQHPFFVDSRIPCSGDLCSAATGAAQWMPDTWITVKGICGDRLNPNEPEFGPENQDRAMICWLDHLGTLPKLLKGLAWKDGSPTVNRENFQAAVFSACGKWASLPCDAQDVDGAHGQGAVVEGKVWSYFQEQVDLIYAP